MGLFWKEKKTASYNRRNTVNDAHSDQTDPLIVVEEQPSLSREYILIAELMTKFASRLVCIPLPYRFRTGAGKHEWVTVLSELQLFHRVCPIYSGELLLAFFHLITVL